MTNSKILIVAKNGRSDCREPLAAFGAKVRICPPMEAVAGQGRFEPDITIIDCGADNHTGLWILRGLKREHPDLPVVFVAEASSEELVINAFKAGAQEYFRKPLDWTEFLTTVGNILLGKRSLTRKAFVLSLFEGRELIEVVFPAFVPMRMTRAINYMLRNLAKPLYLEDIARQACLSKYHFCRMFKKSVGMTPIQFMMNLRINRAKLLLSNPSHSIASAAFSVGYEDLTEFNRQFKKLTGSTPSAFRKSA